MYYISEIMDAHNDIISRLLVAITISPRSLIDLGAGTLQMHLVIIELQACELQICKELRPEASYQHR